jgi:hypothetical protein
VSKPSIVTHGRQFVKHVVPAVVKPARTLWHEVIGFLFICIALWFAVSGYQHVKKFDGSIGSILSVAGFAFIVTLMSTYGISSFLRARKISRS